MKKLMLIMLGMVLMVGVVGADPGSLPGSGGGASGSSSVVGDRELYNTSFNIPIGNVVAGSYFEASFSFDYLNNMANNVDDSPFIVKLEFESNDSKYPVWKGDFEVGGRIEKCDWTILGICVNSHTVYFECSELESQVISHPIGNGNVDAPNGTFYCYNVSSGDLNLDEHDDVYLDVISNYAIYPGKYNISASMFYLTDGTAPFVNIVNKGVFDLYYREIDSVEILATITDWSGIKNYPYGISFLDSENITFPFTHEDSGIYHFSRNTPIDINEGDYELFIFAEDDYNNTGNDSVTLKIDRTAPNITLIQPDSNSTYGENDSLIIEVGVIDVKAGLDNSTVMYRISEVVNSSFCPDSGVMLGNYSCYNSGWVDSWDSDFVTEINISGSDFVSGSYWLEAGACDILGNCGAL